MKIKFILFSFSFLILSSCQQLSRWLDLTPTEEFNSFVKTGQYCEGPTEFQIIGSNPLANNQFVNEIIKKNKSFDLYTLAAMLSLYQMDIRPEQSGPSSRIQFFIYDGKKWIYRDFNNSITQQKNQNNFPFMAGLKWLASKSPEKELNKIAQRFDQISPKYIFVGPVFAKWLDKNKDQFLESDSFREHFFKGDQVVVYGESIQSLNHTKIVQSFAPMQDQINVFTDLPFSQQSKDKSVSYSCNFDPKIYQEMILLNEDPRNINANVFGFKFKSGEIFIGISMQKNPQINQKTDQFLLASDNPIRPVPFCFVETKNNKLAIMGNGGIDPAQHIMQLIDLGLDQVQTAKEYEQRLMQARTLFLVKPARMAVETKLISNERLAELHHFQLPLYHSDALGEIWTWLSLPNQSTFIADPRYERGIQCIP